MSLLQAQQSHLIPLHKLYIRNLPVGIHYDYLLTILRSFGEVVSLRIIRTNSKGQPLPYSNYAFAEFASRAAADSAISTLSACSWQIKYTSHPQVSSEEVGNLIWSGFLTRSLKHRVGIDVYLLKGSEEDFPQTLHHLNISHRTPLSEVLKLTPLSLIRIESSNETQSLEFDNYIKYFTEKDRAGYVALGSRALYLIPPAHESEFGVGGGKGMLGVICNNQALLYPLQLEIGNSAEAHCVWGGALTRSGRFKVGVRGFLLAGRFGIQGRRLDVRFRGGVEEVKKARVTGAVRLEAIEGQEAVFNEHVRYFEEKKRVGVVTLGEVTLFVVPPGLAEKELGVKIQGMLGVLCIAQYK